MNFNEHRIVQDRDRSNIQIDQSNGKLACALWRNTKIIIVSIVDIIIRIRRRDRLQTKGGHNIVQYHKTMSQYIWFTEGVQYAIKQWFGSTRPHPPTFGSIDPIKPFFLWGGGGFPKAFVHFPYLCWKIGPAYCYLLDNGATWRTTEHLSRMKNTSWTNSCVFAFSPSFLLQIHKFDFLSQ